MINKPILVGCGTIGATLALKLTEEKIVSQLKIYDFDVVSFNSTQNIYPFNISESGIPKVQIIKFMCKKLHPNLCIDVYPKKVIHPFNNNDFIIDCRDCKRPILNSNIRLSLDGYLLYIDSCKVQEDNKNYYKYIFPKNPTYINSAINIIVDYLRNDEYNHHDFRLYNIKKMEQYILKQENFHGLE